MRYISIFLFICIQIGTKYTNKKYIQERAYARID